MAQYRLMFLCMILTSCFTYPNEPLAADDFHIFWNDFKKTTSGGDPREIAKLIHFPLNIYGQKFTKQEFIDNRDESVNFFSPYVIKEIKNSRLDDIITYRAASELGAKDCDDLPRHAPVHELDIVNERGGPAMRLIFAQKRSAHLLFCIIE